MIEVIEAELPFYGENESLLILPKLFDDIVYDTLDRSKKLVKKFFKDNGWKVKIVNRDVLWGCHHKIVLSSKKLLIEWNRDSFWINVFVKKIFFNIDVSRVAGPWHSSVRKLFGFLIKDYCKFREELDAKLDDDYTKKLNRKREAAIKIWDN
jgi:hypothetical protein